jgi:hypothetical protein
MASVVLHVDHFLDFLPKEARTLLLRHVKYSKLKKKTDQNSTWSRGPVQVRKKLYLDHRAASELRKLHFILR